MKNPVPATLLTRGREGGHDSFHRYSWIELRKWPIKVAEFIDIAAESKSSLIEWACNEPRGPYHRAMVRYVLPTFLLAALVFSVGCEAPRAGGPTETVLRLADRDAFIDATLTVLRENDFRPQQVDRVEGLAIAGPSTSGQWFEFWRSDSQGAYQSLESSLHTMRRLAIIRVTPAAVSSEAASQPGAPTVAGDGLFRVSVTVEKSRYSASERQLTTAAGALAIYSSQLPTEEGLRNARTIGEHWVPLGRDVLLEQWFLERFAGLAGSVPTDLPQPEPISASAR